MSLRIQCTVIDCTDALRVGTFWADLLGRPLGGPEDDGVYWIEPGENLPELLFIPVPEAKSVKNRLHIDLRPDDQAAEVERALALGAGHVDIGQGTQTWAVLADPEGNEFCILRALRPDES
ncbi:MAG: VOC family protein [Candidatus Dormibacteraeota bacterium]|uniref:VOC family protein n=1 Tax=Candidatus Amunia macphersoniae TaxID=3127014 RepID=A0A934KN55_9BACT|nr:VOC family protein [Candidatus Dormibacteraeota bacterium]